MELLDFIIHFIVIIGKMILEGVIFIISLIWGIISAIVLGAYEYIKYGESNRMDKYAVWMAWLLGIFTVALVGQGIIREIIGKVRTPQNNHDWNPPYTPPPRPKPVPPPPPPQQIFFLDKNEYLHGTKNLSDALDIYFNNHWLIGKNTPDNYPKGIYVTKSLDYAINHAGQNGAIVLVEISQELNLIDIGSERLLLEIPTPKNNLYYFPEGINPIAVYDADLNRIM